MQDILIHRMIPPHTYCIPDDPTADYVILVKNRLL